MSDKSAIDLINELDRENDARKKRLSFNFLVAKLVLNAAIQIGIAYVALHFIIKFW